MEMESPLDVTPTASYEEGFHCTDPFSIPDLLKRFDYGSAANKIEAILAKKSAINKCATDIEEESPNTVTGVAVPVVLLSSDDEDNGSRRSLKLYQKAVSEPTSDPHQHVMEDETPNNVTAVAPPIVVLSSDDEDNGSRSPVHLYQKFVFESVGRVLRRNVTQSAEGKDKSKELETPPREFDSWISKDVDGDRADNMMIDSNDQIEELETLPGKDDTGIDIDVDVGTTSNVDFSESKDEREELEIIPKKVDLWLDKDVDIGAEDNMDCVDSIDQTEELENLPGKIDVGIAKDVADNTDYLESKAQREKLETIPGKIDIEIGKDINVGAAYHMMMGKWNQRASEKENCNYQTSYEDTIENIECIAPSLEVGFLADNMDVETDKRKHVNEAHENKVVGEGDYETVQIKEQYLKSDSEEDDVAEMWKEMAMGECSKDIAVDNLAEETSVECNEDCDHCFILKDDLGIVCRICGIVQKGIETIFEFQYSKAKRTRTYMYESRNANSTESTQNFSVGLKSTGDDFMETEIHAHPRHRNQMKPHQVEGFNFLASNLLTDNPGGCILAHAPGSGKTFLIISFVQSFLARFPHSRPLIVLPKGILATWKKEFLIWQVEDIPLHDFYTSKADNRSQQLDVLKQWVEQKSILLLGYQQFSTIMCDNGTSRTSVDCQEILLKVPSILILDEGHTPRNEDTNILQSLARVQTPLKVVLSGTLYQNHVKEVFNILNLVRPNFLKLDTSRAVIKRIMSRVQISGVRKQFQNGTHAAFFDLVEHTLQKDEDFRRRVSVIQDLREMTRKVLHYYKGDSLDELPGLVDFTVVLNLSSRQKLAVKNLKKLDNFKKASVGSLVYMHPELKSLIERYSSTGGKGSEIDNEKIDKLLGKMNVRDGVKAKFFLSILGLCESTGEKLLVFSQYIPPLKFMERLAVKEKGWSLNKEIFMITGDSNAKDRERSVERFNTSADAKVFFGSIKACGEGISLVGASRILIMDVQLNPSVTRQAIGRSFRPGQKKRVYVYRLVAADSPEEEDHFISCRKDLISKMWFEWSKSYGNQDFGMMTVDVNECADMFLESEMLQKDIKVLQKR